MSAERDRRIVEAALARGYLSQSQLLEAQALRQQRGGALLPLLAERYLAPEHVAELRKLVPTGRYAPTEEPPRPPSDRAATVVDAPSPAPVDRGAGTVSIAPGAPPAGGLSAIPSAPRMLQPGEELGGYTVERALAQGGMGAIYIARQKGLDRQVALKVMLRGDDRARTRFLRESRAIAKLRHPNVVAVHEAGEEGGRPFLVMDLVEGESLKDCIDREGPMEEGEAARIFEKLARAIAAAHASSILHRDLKPANVLLDLQRQPRVTDFGLARYQGELAQSLTKTGQLVGTPAYMAPEQAKGDKASIDERTDVYGLGATLYEALTGEQPFDAGGTANMVVAVVMHDLQAPSALRPGLDRDLEAICLRCMQRDPAKRYASAAELAEALAGWLRGERPRRQRIFMGLAGGVLGLAGIAVVAALAWAEEPPLPEPVVKTPVVDPIPDEEREPTPAEREASRRLDDLLLLPEPNKRLGLLDRWIESWPSHERLPDARRGRAQALLKTPLRTFPHERAKGARFMPDGQGVLTYGTGRVVEWHPDREEEVRAWELPDCSGLDLEFRPGEAAFAMCGKGNVYLVPLAPGAAPRKMNSPGSATRLAWSPSGRLLAIGGDQGNVRVLKPKGKGWVAHKDYHAHGEPVMAVAFQTEKLLLTACGPSFDRPWRGDRKANGECVVRVFDVSRKNKKPMNRVNLDGPPMCLTAEDPGTYLVGCEGDRLYRFTTMGRMPAHSFVAQGLTGAHTGQIRGVAVSPTRPWIASGSGNDYKGVAHNEVRVWHRTEHREITQMLALPNRCQTIEFSVTGRRLLVGTPVGAELWDLSALFD